MESRTAETITEAQRRWRYWRIATPMVGWPMFLREPWWLLRVWGWFVGAMFVWSWWMARRQRED